MDLLTIITVDRLAINDDIEEITKKIDDINIDKDTNTFSRGFVSKIKKYIIYLKKDNDLLREDNDFLHEENDLLREENDLLREDRDKAERKVGILKRKKKNYLRTLKIISKLS